MTTRFSSILRLISEAAPAMTIAALLLMPLAFPNQVQITQSAELRQAVIQEAMRETPLSIGAWIGKDIEVPPAAMEMLHTTAVFSRRYDRLTNGAMVSVLIVHVTDTRDMLGHYPPVCYPSNGWTGRDNTGVALDLKAEDMTIPVTEYLYARPGEYGTEVQIRIFNFFVLPDGTLTRNKADINRQSERLGVAVQGAAQVQVITDARSVPRDEALAKAGELLSGMDHLFKALGVSGEKEDA